MKNTFKAAVLTKLKKELEIINLEIPQKLNYGQILVKMNYSSICGSQIGEIDGVKGDDKYLPHLLGHEGVGKVLKFGKGVTKVNIGDQVILHWKIGRGLQSENPNFLYRGKKINAGSVTTFSEYTIVSENRVSKIETHLPQKILPLLGCCIPTAFGAFENNAKVKFSENIIIFGAGGIGINIIIAAMRLNCKITVIDVNDKKLKFINKNYKCEVVNINNKKSINKLIKNSNIDKFDVCFETTGNVKNIELGYKLINELKGRVILLGVPKKNKLSKLYTLDMHFGKKLIGSHGGSFNPDLDLQRYVKFIENNLNIFIKQIDKVISLNDINKAISDMRNNESLGKIIIKF